MLWELIAMLFSGAAMAGVVMLMQVISRGRLPKWLTPVSAALAMIAFSINAEYAWYPRSVSALPAGIEVTVTREKSKWYRPWTLSTPYVEGFIAVDTSDLLTNPALPNAKLATLYVFARGIPPIPRRAIFDCQNSLRADIEGDSLLPGEGDWRPVATGDPTLAKVCEV